MKRIIPALFFLTIVLSSCHHFPGRGVQGSGTIIKQDRAINGFENVEVNSALDVFIKQDSSFEVKVEADNNLQEYIEVHKEGETLYISIRSNVSLEPSQKVKVYVSAPVYKLLKVSGASSLIKDGKISSDGVIDIEINGASNADLDLKAPEVKIDLTGASSIALTGETRTFNVKGSGSSSIHCYGLQAENTDVDISGACDADVYASVKLNASASGASHVSYKGNATVTSNTSGASSMEKVQ
ncbi:MAG TPA: head GIN domain-containing protein [Chitinophagaceae bacterium]